MTLIKHWQKYPNILPVYNVSIISGLYSEESESSATEEVVPDYDPDDLYDGSDSSLDEEDAGGDIKRRKM